MTEVFVLTEAGVTDLPYDAVLWLVEHATLELPDGTLDRLDQGLQEGVVALNASDLDAIVAFCEEQLDVADTEAPGVAELTQVLKTWARR